MKRTLFLSLAAAALVAVFAPEPADARRARVFDVTDPETKAYCQRNPDRCEKGIAWGPTVLMWVGIPVAFAGLRALPSLIKRLEDL